jgi:hypothetical protein
VIERVEHASRLLCERHARGGRRDDATRAIEKLDAELLLELADGLRERRLCDVKPFRRMAEVELLTDGEEVPQVSQVDRGRLVITWAFRFTLSW